MKNLALDAEITIEDPNVDIDVEITFRCWFSEHHAMYPMTVETSICSGDSLQKIVADSKKDYEKSYLKVELVSIMADI